MRYLLLILLLKAFTSYSQQPLELHNRLSGADENEKVDIYNRISLAYSERQPDSAVYYANKGMQLAEKLNDQHGQAALLLALGHINAQHHHVELARRFYNEALGLYRRVYDVAGIAHTYDQLGLLDGNSKDFNKALKYYNDTRDSAGLIETYEDLGKAAEIKKDHEEAISWYLRALTQYEHRKQKPETYFVLLESLGKLYHLKGDSKTALHYLNEGLKQSSQQQNVQAEVRLLNDEAALLSDDHNDSIALALYKRALSEAKKYRQPDQQAEALIGIAAILKKQDANASIQDLNQALAIAGQLHEPKLAARIYAALGGVHRQQKHYNEALTALDEERHLVDSLLNADTVKEIAALDSSYRLERSLEQTANLQNENRVEKTELNLALILSAAIFIILLLFWRNLREVKRLNAKLQHLNDELTNSNRIKDTLFSVIGHDLKGPAGSTAQLFELMESDDVSHDEMKGIISELRKQTSASLELLKSLFAWGTAQLQGVKVNPTNFQVKFVAERCIHLLNQQATIKQIKIHQDVPIDLFINADVDHVEFIIRNLISNAIKFTNSGGFITVGSYLEGGQAVLFVKDTGVGISQDQQVTFHNEGLKVTFGTANEKGSGLGLLLTKDFVKANHGRIWLESILQTGTTFFVAIPAL